MLQLTVELEESAKMLGVNPGDLLEMVQEDEVNGVFRANGSWRVSIFTMASLLNTTPERLLGLIQAHEPGILVEEWQQYDEWAL